jgi:hypothetical protein
MNIEINKIVSNSVQTKLNDIYSYKNFNLKEEDIFDNNKSLEYFLEWKKTQEHSNKLQQDLEETQEDLVITYQELNKFKNISEKTQQDLETTFQELDTVKYQLECCEILKKDLKQKNCDLEIKLDLQENVIYIKNILFILMFIVLLIVLPYLF